MKIGFITQNEAPFRMRWMDELAKYADVIVYHVGEYEKGFNEKYLSYKADKAKVINIKEEYGIRFFDYSIIKNESFDVIILDGYGFLAQQRLIMELKIRKVPFMMSLDGGFIKNESWIKRKVKELIISSASAYFSTSKETDSFICYYNKKEPQIYRHYFSSISSNEIKPYLKEKEKRDLRKELDIEDIFTVITVGQFIPRKGFDILIQSLKYLKGNVQVCFAGIGERSVYDNIIPDNPNIILKFVGFCDRDLLNKYYRASDLFVFPSREDVWGLVIGEAMAHGLPVITTNMCLAGKAMIKEGVNGYIVPVEDYIELAKRIQILMDDLAKRVEIGKRNIEDVKKYCIEMATKEDIKNIKDYMKV